MPDLRDKEGNRFTCMKSIERLVSLEGTYSAMPATDLTYNLYGLVLLFAKGWLHPVT